MQVFEDVSGEALVLLRMCTLVAVSRARTRVFFTCYMLLWTGPIQEHESVCFYVLSYRMAVSRGTNLCAFTYVIIAWPF